MPEKSADRSAYFPAIEKRYGEKMEYWFKVMEKIKELKYPEQIAHLKENYGFSQAHANALVMYSRGSKSSKRFTTVDQYLEQFDETKQSTVRKMLKAIMTKHKKLELVMAWNQPMLRINGQYVFGVTVLKNHILIAPWSKDVLADFEERLSEYVTNKKTIQVPVDWKVDVRLLQDMVQARIGEIDNTL